MKTRTTLYADEGKMLTNGKDYGSIVHLEVGSDASAWHEISEEEYNAAVAESEECTE